MIEKNNLIIKEKHELENQIEKIKTENENTLDEMIKNKSEIEKKCNDTIKENEKLQDKIKQLTLLHDDLEEQLNSMNIKYRDIKKTLNEKEKELSDLKEVSQELIQKEKKQVEQLDSIEPDKCKIISDKKYKKLTWYLIYENNTKKGNTEEDEENKYENYRWVNGAVLKKNKLEKFNKYESDEDKIKDLNEYVLKLQKKLEQKEESFSKLDYQNKKLIKEIHNKTAGEGLLRHHSHSKGKIEPNKNTSIDVGEPGFKNILEELNKSNEREKQLQNKIIKLNNQIKDANKNENQINDNENLNLEQAQEQIILLKGELKEIKDKLEQLIGQVKEILKNVKCDNKIKPYFVQICQLLNLSPKTTNRIITNNNKKAIIF